MNHKAIFFFTAGICSSFADTSLTIYNQGIAVIREDVPLSLKDGVTRISFDQVTAQVRPDSVVLRDPTGKIDFAVLEQSYRNDPVSQNLLLDHFEGQTIDFRKETQDGSIKVIQGEIIRSGYFPNGRHQSPIIKVDGKMQFSLPGQPLFPALGDDSILQPTLSWNIAANASSELDAQLSYMTGGLGWKASYNIVAPEEGETVNVNGWVTVNNNSGTGFKDATLKLVAGDINVNHAHGALIGSPALAKSRSLADVAEVTEKAFDDFHLYTLPRPLTLRDQETKQVEFLSSSKVKAQKRYIYAPASNFRYYGGKNYNKINQEFSRDVSTWWEFKNSQDNGLGVPFPQGTMRFYRSDDADGNLEFVGENNILHTPKNETISVNTGNAFDLLGERKATDFQVSRSKDWLRESYEVTLTNRSEDEKTIIVREPMWRWSNWEIEKNSMDYTKIDAQTIEFTVTLPADSKKTVSYTAHYFDR